MYNQMSAYVTKRNIGATSPLSRLHVWTLQFTEVKTSHCWGIYLFQSQLRKTAKSILNTQQREATILRLAFTTPKTTPETG